MEKTGQSAIKQDKDVLQFIKIRLDKEIGCNCTVIGQHGGILIQIGKRTWPWQVSVAMSESDIEELVEAMQRSFKYFQERGERDGVQRV